MFKKIEFPLSPESSNINTNQAPRLCLFRPDPCLQRIANAL